MGPLSLPDPLLDRCPACAAEVDVTGCAPFAPVICPACEVEVRVRRTFQQYEIETEIGRGGMSRVFRAHDPALGRAVAMKVLLESFHDSDERVQQFEKEAQITASFTHPHVVKVYSVGRDHADLFIVMELVEHGSLDERMQKQGAIHESQALKWILETAQGLQAAYQNGLIHRDVKPGNILLTQDGSAKLVDFGLALMFRREVDESEDIWATPYYVAPEKLAGASEDHRSDIYSLGATLYHLLAGKPSFEVNTGSYEELSAAKAQAPDVREVAAHVSPGTASLVAAMMDPDPDKRPDSYDDLVADLESAANPRRSAHPISASDRFLAKQQLQLRKRRRQRAWFLGILGVGSLVLAAGVWQLTKPSPEQSTNAMTVEEEGVSEEVSGSNHEVADRGWRSHQGFRDGREALLASNWEGARARFEEMATTTETPAAVPWAWYHAGLAALLQGEPSNAREAFAHLSVWEDARSQWRDFFRTIGQHVLRSEPIPPKVARDMPDGFCHGAALLVYGLHNWEAGAPKAAHAHWERFFEHQPERRFAWLTEYRALVRPHMTDLERYLALPDLETLVDAESIRKALENLPDWVARAKTARGKEAFRERETILRERLERLENPDLDGEWQAVLAQLDTLAESQGFAEGVALLGGERARVAKGKRKAAFEDVLHWWQEAGALQERLQHSVSDPLGSADPKGVIARARENLAAERDSNAYYRDLEGLIAFARLTNREESVRPEIAILKRENRPFRERWNRMAHQTSP